MTKTTSALQALDDKQTDALRAGIEKIEKFEERTAQINADKRQAYEVLVALVEPLGYEKSDLTKLVGRRKKDRERVTEQDRRVYKLEIALGMATSDLFDEAANTIKTASCGADATAASLKAGNAAPKNTVVNIKPTTAKKTPPADSPVELSDQALKDSGRAAWAKGTEITECKYLPGTHQSIMWIAGWNEAKADWDAEQVETNAPMVPATGTAYLRQVADI